MALLLHAATSWADPAADAAAAEHLFSEARALMAAKNYAGACPKLEASQRLDPGAGTLLNLASCYEALGRTASAWATYRDAEGAADRSQRLDWKKSAHEQAEALAPALSRLRITVPPPNAAPGLVVERDGQKVDAASWGDAVPVDPGLHEIRASAPGMKTWQVRTEVPAKGASVELTVPALEPARAEERPPETEAAPPRSSPEGKTGAGQRTIGFLVGGAGAAVLGVGAILGLVANGTYSSAVDHDCAGNAKTCTQGGVDRIHTASSQATWSTVFFGVGGAAVAAGVILVLTAPSGRPVALGVAPQASGSSLVAQGRF
jgi:hypothetical protein